MAGERHGRDMDAAWERHAMCASNITVMHEVLKFATVRKTCELSSCYPSKFSAKFVFNDMELLIIIIKKDDFHAHFN